MKYNHDKISGIYDQLTNIISLYQTVKTKDYLLRNLNKNKSLLDIGCGNGDFAISCASKVAKVVALDVSNKMIRHARANARDNNLKNVKFILKDFFSFRSDIKFDYVTLVYFLNVFLNEDMVEMVLKKARSHLKPGGYMLIADELEPTSMVLSQMVNIFRLPVFNFFYVTTGLRYHKIHDLEKVLKRLDIKIIEEKRFLYQYCSVLIGKV